MALDIVHEAGRVFAALDDELTVYNALEIKDELFGLLNHQDVRIDLSSLRDIDSCGAQMLAILAIEAARAGKSLIWLRGNERVDIVMDILGFSRLLPAPEEE